ncbi:MAG: sporulation integral membrane protein YtvI [Clostridia bacterium]|nr:sporulation integral membrane protein YtvI [Clostridia bacterium]
MEGFAWERWAAMLFCLAAGALGVILAWRYLLPVFFPFLLAWLISLGIHPLSRGMARILRLPQKGCAAVLFLLFLSALVLLATLSVRRVLQELTGLLDRLVENDGRLPGFSEGFFDPVAFVMQRFGAEGGDGGRYAAFREELERWMTHLSEQLMETLSREIPALAGRILGALPSAFLVTVVTVIAGFYFCMAEAGSWRRRLAWLPLGLRERLPRWKQRLKQISWRYLRVYLLLLLLTFGELLFGFLLLGVEYAFLLAVVVAVVDLLPILGVGTVLVPWALVVLLQKNYFLGFGLLILYAAVVILRQLLEPRLMGKSLGLSPLLALFAGYAGWRLLGFWGMALGPVAALLVKSAVAPMRERLVGGDGVTEK